MNERREEGRLRMRKVEGEMLNMMTYPSQSIDAVSLSEGTGVEGDMDAGEEALGKEVAVGGGGLTQSTDI